MSDTNYDWPKGVFNPSCVCGGSINHPNADCERCAMHDWIYKQQTEIERLEQTVRLLEERVSKAERDTRHTNELAIVAEDELAQCQDSITVTCLQVCDNCQAYQDDYVHDLEADNARLLAERDEARYAARWLYQWVSESEWTHFCKEDGDMLKQWTWLLEATNG